MFRQKHFKSYVIASIAMLSIVSCQKKTTTQPVQPAPVACRMAETKTTSSDGVTKKYTFFYDKAHHITSTVVGNVFTPTFFYNVDESLTYDKAGRLTNTLSTRRMYNMVKKTRYTWANNGLLEKVAIGGDDTRTYMYTYKYDHKKRVIETFVEIAGKLAQKFTYLYNSEGNVAEAKLYNYVNKVPKLERKLVYTTFDNKPFVYKGLPFPYNYSLMFYGAIHANNPTKGYLLVDSNADGVLTDEEKKVITNKLEYNEEGFPTKIYSNHFDMTIMATYECK